MQGFNMGRYYAPSTSSTPSFNTSRTKATHPPTIRFELPFAIWCTTCTPQPLLLGQGLRFNATKARIGTYHSTPIWAFTFRHPACGGSIEIRTDPARSEYSVHAGARRRDYGASTHAGEDAEDVQGVRVGAFGGEIVSAEEKERRRLDAFAALEGRKGEKERVRGEGERVEGLWRARERDWGDPWMANKRLRGAFRAERKLREEEGRRDEDVREKFGLPGEMELMPETAGDRARAGAVEFGEEAAAAADGDEMERAARNKAYGQPLFANKATKKQHHSSAVDARKARLRSNLVANTRVNASSSTDFAAPSTTAATKGDVQGGAGAPRLRITGLKRKGVGVQYHQPETAMSGAEEDEEGGAAPKSGDEKQQEPKDGKERGGVTGALVGYASSSSSEEGPD